MLQREENRNEVTDYGNCKLESCVVIIVILSFVIKTHGFFFWRDKMANALIKK